MITVMRDNSEIECKGSFQKPYSARGRSNWSRCIEESEMIALVKKERKVAVLYSGCLGFITTAFSKKDDQTTPLSVAASFQPDIRFRRSIGQTCSVPWRIDGSKS
jgi:hypothetical protein